MTNETTSSLHDKVLGCLVAGVVGDAMGTPTEKLTHEQIRAQYGWLDYFSGEGTDDSLLKHMLCETLQRSGGHASADLWAEDWLRHAETFIDSKLFFVPVLATFWKLRAERIAPREAGSGNIASSSSAMCISPIGIVNAGNPRQAALETYEIASLIHHNCCRDGASAMAAAVAAAFAPQASVDSVLDAAARYLPPRSAQAMLEALDQTLALAREAGQYETFRERYLAGIDPNRHFTDSRETVPLSLALLYLAQGDLKRTVEYGANFGRDADTIASMAGAVAGALAGAKALPAAWLQTLGDAQMARQRELAARMLQLTVARAQEAQAIARAVLEAAR